MPLICKKCNRWLLDSRVITPRLSCASCGGLRIALDIQLARTLISAHSRRVAQIVTQETWTVDEVLLTMAEHEITRYRERTLLALKEGVLSSVRQEVRSVISRYDARAIALMALNLFQAMTAMSHEQLATAQQESEPTVRFWQMTDVLVARHALLYLAQLGLAEAHHRQREDERPALPAVEMARLFAKALLMIAWWDDVEGLRDSQYDVPVQVTGEYRFVSGSRDDEQRLAIQWCRNRLMGLWLGDQYVGGRRIDPNRIEEFLEALEVNDRRTLAMMAETHIFLKHLFEIDSRPDFKQRYRFGIGNVFRVLGEAARNIFPYVIDSREDVMQRLSAVCGVGPAELDAIVEELCFDQAVSKEVELAEKSNDLDYRWIIAHPIGTFPWAGVECLAVYPLLMSDALNEWVKRVVQGGLGRKGSRTMSRLFGRHQNEWGRRFEQDVEQFLRDKGCRTRRGCRVTSGEIDILALGPGTAFILVIECKNFEEGKRYGVMRGKEVAVNVKGIERKAADVRGGEVTKRVFQVDRVPAEVVPVLFVAQYHSVLCEIENIDAVLWADRENWWARCVSRSTGRCAGEGRG